MAEPDKVSVPRRSFSPRVPSDWCVLHGVDSLIKMYAFCLYDRECSSYPPRFRKNSTDGLIGCGDTSIWQHWLVFYDKTGQIKKKDKTDKNANLPHLIWSGS